MPGPAKRQSRSRAGNADGDLPRVQRVVLRRSALSGPFVAHTIPRAQIRELHVAQPQRAPHLVVVRAEIRTAVVVIAGVRESCGVIRGTASGVPSGSTTRSNIRRAR